MNRFEFQGLAELRAALRQLPSELAGEAVSIVDDATGRTESSLLQAYPLGETGKMRAGVSSAVVSDRGGVIGTVRSKSPHARLWEFGTAVRATRQGWNRGRAPSHKTEGLVAIAQRERSRMNQQLIELVRRAGFAGSGVP